MNWIDLVLILIIALSVWNGWHKGFILGLLQLITWLGSLLIGFLGYQYVAILLHKHIPSLNVWTLPVAFILTVLVARMLLSIIANQLLQIMPEETHYNEINKVLGLIPGFVNGVIYATLVASLLLVLPLFSPLINTTRNSVIANKLATKADWVDEKLSPIFNAAVNRSLSKLTVEPKSNETVKLPFKITDAKVRANLEMRMLALLNEERSKRSLPLLRSDPELTAVARAHSEDMFANGYFSHYTPDGKSPFDRMKKAGVRFTTAGENLALGQTLLICHQGLMNSPGHRANILQPAFGRVGIGILDGGIFGLMISQEFRN